MQELTSWLSDYTKKQTEVYAALPLDQIAGIIEVLHSAWSRKAQVFVFGNGGSAANASHFVTDVGKGSSDKLGTRFRILTLNDNTAWMTAIGNDYSYEDVFLRQLQNYANPGDVALCMSVSGNSPNLVKATKWAKEQGLSTIALVGAKRGALAEIAEHVLVIEDTHYGRVEDAQMTICHMLAYAFMEKADVLGARS
ncbi:D-sedoheptulose-7-phosphate isomerase [Singulisphaera sp. PoT]|uniref:D-sedoheptulose-7-phosphate isomerase n=1 Tax=Singulisphaera sp. PoT TaxID=3411797 RepID=UPI003BF5F412